MSILDQLIEKKDILAYIRFRSEDLKDKICREELQKLESKERGALIKVTKTRIDELNHFGKLIRENRVKKEAIMHATYVKTKARLEGRL